MAAVIQNNNGSSKSMQARCACGWNLVLSGCEFPLRHLMRGNGSPFKLHPVYTLPLSQYHNIPTSYPQMPATFQWNSWLSFMTLEYQTGLGNGSSSRWLKGKVPSHNELTLYWSPGRVRHNGKWGRMARHFPLCCRETLGSRAEWWRYKNNALEQMSANFFCPQPDCKILGFAGHMMAVRSSQCSIAAWKQP